MAVNNTHDSSHEALLAFGQRLRQEFIINFYLLLISLLALGFSIYVYTSTVSKRPETGYIAVNPDKSYLRSTDVKTPLKASDEQLLDDWVRDKLVYCLTMDFTNAAQVISSCTSNVFSSYRGKVERNNWSTNGSLTAGQIFYKAIADSNLISLLLDNRTTMTIELISLSRREEGIYQRKVKYNHPDEPEMGEQIVNLRPTYRYVYDAVYKFKMEGLRVDAPIKYEIIVERVGERSREFPVAFRSVRTNE